MQDIFIVGVGMTPFGRHMDKTVKQLTSWAVNDALADCGGNVGQFDVAFFGNTVQGYMEGQIYIPGQIALLPIGFGGVRVSSVVDAVRSIGVTDVTYYRWRSEFGGLKTDQVKRMKDLELEPVADHKAVKLADVPNLPEASRVWVEDSRALVRSSSDKGRTRAQRAPVVEV